MPYEVVQYPRTESPSSTEVSVHWSKQGEYVQLKVERHVFGAPPPGFAPQSVEASFDAFAAAVDADNAGLPRPAETPKSDFTDDPALIFTESLTRPEINRMIRVLRTARDQAFGADA